METETLRPGRLLVLAGVLMILGAAGLAAHNLMEEREAEKASAQVLSELTPEIPSRENEDFAGPLPTPGYLLHPEMPMPEIMIDGEAYIGILEIPSLSLSLPVMSGWDYDRLKKAPCRYAGSVYLDNMVICGHNYRRHFSPVKWMSAGESVIFTDTEGNQFRYLTEDVEILRPEAVDAMVTGDWDLTLFTCTTGGQTRFALRCRREANNTRQAEDSEAGR